MQADEKNEVLGAYFKDAEGNNLECVPDKKAGGPGICPKCGSVLLDYGDDELVDNDISYEFTCGDCGAMGKEWYHMEWIESEVLSE